VPADAEIDRAQVVGEATDEVLRAVQIGGDRESLLADGGAVHDRELHRELLLEERGVCARTGVELRWEHVLLAPAPLDERAVDVRLQNLSRDRQLENSQRELGLGLLVPLHDADGLDFSRDVAAARIRAARERWVDLEDEARVVARHVLDLQARSTKPEEI